MGSGPYRIEGDSSRYHLYFAYCFTAAASSGTAFVPLFVFAAAAFVLIPSRCHGRTRHTFSVCGSRNVFDLLSPLPRTTWHFSARLPADLLLSGHSLFVFSWLRICGLCFCFSHKQYYTTDFRNVKCFRGMIRIVLPVLISALSG